MKLTPVEIKKQEFKKGMRGYDTVEVDTFLEMIADNYRELLEENEKLGKQVLVLESELNNFRDVEKTLKQTLQNVQENSHISKQNSEKEAGLIRKEAELAAAQMLEKTRLQVHKMREEIVSLTNQKHSFISRLKHVLGSQMELLEVLETDDMDISKLKDRTKKATSAPVVRDIPVKRPMSSTPPSGPKNDGAKTDNPGPSQENAEKTHGKGLFNDIFGDDLDVDKNIK